MMNMMMKVFSFFNILILFPMPFHFRYGIFSVLHDNELSYKARKNIACDILRTECVLSYNYFLFALGCIPSGTSFYVIRNSKRISYYIKKKPYKLCFLKNQKFTMLLLMQDNVCTLPIIFSF